MKSNIVSVVILGVFGTTFSVMACAADPASLPPADKSENAQTDDPTSPSKSPTPTASSSASATPSPTTSASSGPPATGDDSACAQKAGDACSDCCYEHHATGGAAADDAESTCLCAANRCATACGKSSYCSEEDNAPDPVAGDACSACMARFENDGWNGECDLASQNAAKATADGQAWLACENNCP